MVRVVLASSVALCACTAPYVEVAHVDGVDAGVDATVDAATDTRTYVYPDASMKLPDGGTCVGHDEDLDGVPDLCDDCPNIADPKQTPSAWPGIGSFCAPDGTATDKWRRVFFDPFLNASLWLSSADKLAFSVYDSFPDRLTGGSPTNNFWMAVARAPLTGTTTMVTTIVKMSAMAKGDSRAGVFGRLSTSNEFVACLVTNEETMNGSVGLAIALAPKGGCPATGDCVLETVTKTTLLFNLSDRYRNEGGMLRMRIADGEGGTGAIECRGSTGNPDTGTVLTATIPEGRFRASGQVGVFVRTATAHFASFDLFER